METQYLPDNRLPYSMSNSRKMLLPKPTVTTLDDLVRELHVVFEQDTVNVEYVHHLMSSYKSKPAEWKKFAKFDRYRYTRNLVDEGNGKFNLMILCWGEGHGSAIHDHADAHCFMKILQGSLSEVRFAWPDEEMAGDITENSPLKEIGRGQLDLNEVCYINDSLGLHRVENTSHTDRAVSLHLYCPPFDACLVFNQQTGQRMKCPVTFWSKYGEKTKREIRQCRPPEDN
ncbi:cysteine dioxygenase type 1 [Anabrus simplex]|uniref:cysteine dioxygenase type 1 n=1 Tax=Anabrus simplex TaxID=316456 RepID=UPI0034DCE557